MFVRPLGPRRGAAAEAAHVVGTQGERRVRKLRNLERDLIGGFAQRFAGLQSKLDGQRFDPRDQLRVHRHQHARLDDVGLIAPPAAPQLSADLLQLRRGHRKRLDGAPCLVVAFGRRDQGRGDHAWAVEHHGSPDRDARGGADPLQGKLAH